MSESKTRREFLQRLAAYFAAASLPAESAWQAAEAGHFGKSSGRQSGKPHFKISEWTGDNFSLGHRFRDREFPSGFPTAPEKTVDFVVVGGGIAGLTSAWYLKDHNFILLDQYETLGGQSRGGSYRAIDYSYGPAYVDTVDGIYGELFGDLGIAPQKLAPGDNGFLFENHWFAGVNSTEANALYAHFKRLLAESAQAIKQLPAEPTPENTQSGDIAKMDSVRFAEVIGDYPPEFVALLQSISQSATCGDIEQVSALTGYYLLEDLGSSNYVFEGGNPAIARALVRKLGSDGSRLVPGAFVWKVVLKDGGADVLYSTADGNLHNISCKHVIVATPPMVAWRQLVNLDDRMRASLMPFRYGSYLVANCLLSKELFKGSYDNWVGSPFTFSDLIVAETPYRLAGAYKPSMGSVLTIYHPWGPGSPGRSLLLEGNRQQFASSIHEQLAQIVEHLDKHLEEIVLTRWGHAMVVPGPNFFAKLRKIQAAYKDKSPFSLAYSATQGLPSAESAIRGARFAADRALAISKTSWVVPRQFAG